MARGHEMKSFKSVRGSSAPTSLLSVQTGDPQNQLLFPRWRWAVQCFPGYVRLVGTLLIINAFPSAHRDEPWSELLHDNLAPHCRGSIDHRSYPSYSTH